MLPRLNVSTQSETATESIVFCSGFVCLSFLAIIGFGLLQKVQAAENTLPPHQVQATPTKLQPKLVANYGKLPLSFEANQGQTDARVRFLARGGGYTIFLTADAAVLTLRKSQPGMCRFGKFGFPGRLKPFDLIDPRGRRWPTLAVELKLLWPSLIPDLSQMVPEPNAGKGGMVGGLESQPPQVLRMRLVGGNAKGSVVGLDELPGHSNYFIGNHPKKWRTNVPSYAKVKYEGVYPGVDLIYYGNQRQLEYDFVVAPGADLDQMKLNFAGADGMRIDPASGDLVLKVGDDEVRLHKPAVYQPIVAAASDPSWRSESGATAELDGTFVLADNNQVAFRVAGYDPKRALVIDPVLSYSTYLGGSGGDQGSSIALDTAGNAYVTGLTESTNFPTVNALQPKCGDCGVEYGSDAFVSKLNPTGSALVYSTYLGGSGADYGYGIAVDAAGSAYVTGYTNSTDFPTANPLQPSYGGGEMDAFVAKLNPAGSALVYSTYLGGSGGDYGYGIALDSAGSAYVTGATGSTDFPTANPLQPSLRSPYNNAFVAKLSPTGNAFIYSTYLGGTSYDSGTAIAVDSAGNAYVTGATGSTDFPTANPLQPSYGGGNYDAFVAKLNPTGSALVYSTYLGGSGGDEGTSIAADSAGNAYVTGATSSTDFPTANPLQANCDGCNESLGVSDAFVAKLNPSGGALVYSTYLGGSGDDEGISIAVDSAGNASVTGGTSSADFPTVNPLQANCDNCSSNNGDAFVTQLNSVGSALVYSTYLGGSSDDYGSSIAVDAAGNVYVTGGTSSTDFPTANPLQPGYGGTNAGSGHGDAFVAKISPAVFSLSPTSLTFNPQNIGSTSVAQALTLNITGEGTLLISSIGVSGDFAQTNNCGSSLAQNSSCTISVTFTPTTTGSRNGSITIADNASVTPQTVGLTGTGTAPVANVSSPTLTFSNQNLGTTSGSQPITLSNTGSGALTIASIATGANFGQTNNCGSSVAASGFCTINVTFSPTATGPLTGTLTITDNNNGVANSTQTVSLSGTGTGPVVSLSAPPTFPSEPVGTTSPAQTVTVTNTGNASLTFTKITVSGTFAIATSGTTCSTSNPVAASGSCKVAVTFTPTAGGSASGNLSFTDNAGNSPQTLVLNGAGQDFTLAAASGSPTSVTVAPGSPASYTLSVSGEGGFDQSVSFTCTGSPSDATCAVSPSPVTPGIPATNVTVSVTTTAPSVSTPRSRPLPPVPPLSPGLRGLVLLALALAATAWTIGRRNQPGVSRWQSRVALLASGLLLTLVLAGCGGGGSSVSTPPPNPGTPAGTYTLTVTGSTGSGSSALSHSVTLTLTVT